jgi:hypothetical protein
LKVLEDDIAEYATDFVSDLIHASTGGVEILIKRFRPTLENGDSTQTLKLADDWAGPVASPTVLERHFGIPRSTLYRWQKANEAVAINTRTSKKPVFPLRQFVDGRPAPGLAQVIEAFGDQREAWKWLVAPNPAFDKAPPLDALLSGQIEDVLIHANGRGIGET